MDTQLNASKDLECDQCDASFPSASEYEVGGDVTTSYVATSYVATSYANDLMDRNRCTE